MSDTKKPDREKHKDIRVPDEDIKLNKDESFKESLKKVSKDNGNNK